MKKTNSKKKKKNTLPTISVVTATFNSGKTLDRCLSLVREQDYPQEKIEIILGDGGSSDNTMQIAKKYKAKVIKIPKEKQHAEYNRGVAFAQAEGELSLILDHDNFIPYKTWLKDMVQPLLDNPRMVATETAYYDYSKQYRLMDRYCALFGISEPLPYYMGKADRLPQNADHWINMGKAVDKGKYYLVEFEPDPLKIPTIGTNACLMRTKLVKQNADTRPDHHYPIDVMVDVIKNGHNQFGFVKNSIIHLTNSAGFLVYIKRRFMFMESYHFQHHQNRRYSVVMKGDEFKVIKYVIMSFTLIVPTLDALRGFLKIHDFAWFVNPFMCFATALVYSYITVKNILLKIFNENGT